MRINHAQRVGYANTTGAIAGMLAGGLYGLDATPDVWRNTLNADIRRSCETPARALIQLAGKLPKKAET